MQDYFTFQLAAFLVTDLLLGSREYHILRTVTLLLLYLISHILAFAVLVECMLMQTTFNVHIVHTGYINHVEA